MSVPQQSECTEEEWAYLEWKNAAEKAVKAHLREAVSLAVQLHGGDYGESYIDGTLSRIWEDRPEPDAPPKACAKASIPRALAKEVFERDAYRCRECGGWQDLCADHIIPESRGGETTLENLQTLCRSCNSRKGARI